MKGSQFYLIISHIWLVGGLGVNDATMSWCCFAAWMYWICAAIVAEKKEKK